MSDVVHTRSPSRGFWHTKRVLVTGHTGFKGSWLAAWLHKLGAELAGLALPEMPTQPALWECLQIPLQVDVRADLCGDDWKKPVIDFDPEVIVHLAAQPLVSEGFAAPHRTFATNVMGTANLLNVLREVRSLECVLVATTDKVYDSQEYAPHTESSRLGGHDPYSASKVGAELVVHSWPDLPCPVVTARAGNVIGGGDWGRDRLLPDLVRNWSTGSTVQLRRPDAVRPWQHVVEPLAGYLVYLEELAAGNTLPRALNFGPSAAQSISVREVVEHATREWARAFDLDRLPRSEINGVPSMPETETLVIESTQADSLLGWRSVLGWREAVTMAIDWYADFIRTGDGRGRLLDQLDRYADSGARTDA